MIEISDSYWSSENEDCSQMRLNNNKEKTNFDHEEDSQGVEKYKNLERLQNLVNQSTIYDVWELSAFAEQLIQSKCESLKQFFSVNQLLDLFHMILTDPNKVQTSLQICELLEKVLQHHSAGILEIKKHPGFIQVIIDQLERPINFTSTTEIKGEAATVIQLFTATLKLIRVRIARCKRVQLFWNSDFSCAYLNLINKLHKNVFDKFNKCNSISSQHHKDVFDAQNNTSESWSQQLPLCELMQELLLNAEFAMWGNGSDVNITKLIIDVDSQIYVMRTFYAWLEESNAIDIIKLYLKQLNRFLFKMHGARFGMIVTNTEDHLICKNINNQDLDLNLVISKFFVKPELCDATNNLLLRIIKSTDRDTLRGQIMNGPLLDAFATILKSQHSCKHKYRKILFTLHLMLLMCSWNLKKRLKHTSPTTNTSQIEEKEDNDKKDYDRKLYRDKKGRFRFVRRRYNYNDDDQSSNESQTTPEDDENESEEYFSALEEAEEDFVDARQSLRSDSASSTTNSDHLINNITNNEVIDGDRVDEKEKVLAKKTTEFADKTWQFVHAIETLEWIKTADTDADNDAQQKNASLLEMMLQKCSSDSMWLANRYNSIMLRFVNNRMNLIKNLFYAAANTHQLHLLRNCRIFACLPIERDKRKNLFKDIYFMMAITQSRDKILFAQMKHDFLVYCGSEIWENHYYRGIRNCLIRIVCRFYSKLMPISRLINYMSRSNRPKKKKIDQLLNKMQHDDIYIGNNNILTLLAKFRENFNESLANILRLEQSIELKNSDGETVLTKAMDFRSYVLLHVLMKQGAQFSLEKEKGTSEICRYLRFSGYLDYGYLFDILQIDSNKIKSQVGVPYFNIPTYLRNSPQLKIMLECGLDLIIYPASDCYDEDRLTDLLYIFNIVDEIDKINLYNEICDKCYLTTRSRFQNYCVFCATTL